MAAQGRGAGAQGGAAAAEPLPAGVTPAADARRLLSRDTLRALVQHVLGEQVAPEVEELLLDVGDDFLEHVAAGSAALARHRGSAMLEASDVRLHVERVWGMPLPGHGGDEVEPMRASGETETHRARLAAVRRTAAAAFHAAAATGPQQGGAPGR